MNKTLIESALLKNKLITEPELQRIKNQSFQDQIPFEDLIVDQKFISERALLEMTAQELGLRYSYNPISLFQEEVLDLVSEDFARANQIMPLYIEGQTLYIATDKPSSIEVFEDLSMMTSYDTRAVISPSSAIMSMITRAYTEDKAEDSILKDLELSAEDQELMARVDSAPIVKLVNSIISAAYNDDASDVHIDPEEKASLVRFRVDGQLSNYMQIKRELHAPVITRVKIMAGMNIAEKRIPQDGSLRLTINKQSIDIRIATIPTRYGEKLVMRLLGSEKGIEYKIDKLQMNKKMREYLKSLTKMSNGIILITGPTGSGKTTTLYSMLNEIATPDKSVITIEDPIEKEFKGISQISINIKAGLNFASGLRSILRLDPDVIMIGEIRDAETASISIRAAITGHLVLSTLHTNDALSSITRLIDMGTENYMVASSVKSVIAQRLVRKNCEHCKVQTRIKHEDQILLQDTSLIFYSKGEGCSYCDFTGYRGRIAVFEAIPIDQNLQTMVSAGKSYKEMRDYVQSQDIPLLKDDLVRLLKGGDTTVEEARNVLFSNELF